MLLITTFHCYKPSVQCVTENDVSKKIKKVPGSRARASSSPSVGVVASFVLPVVELFSQVFAYRLHSEFEMSLYFLILQLKAKNWPESYPTR